MTRSPALTALLVLPLLMPACSDDGATDAAEQAEAEDELDATTSDSSSGESSESSSSSSSSSSTSSSSTSDTTDTTDATDTTSTSETTASDTTSETTGEVDNSTYTATAFPGGFDRVIVERVNPDEPSCTQMVLYSPVMFDMFDVDVPGTWRIEEVRSWDQLECDLMQTPDSLAEGGVGTIQFLGTDAFDLYPCAMAFDIEFDMDTDPPSTMIFATDFVMVEGVNCG
jgi:hypothetical protein